ncbi:MORN repeat-containing protein 4-like [Ylistrum balloti]|uniref:MORN repeat-containing protein 4-like n=1 Tax=Ylistrum balloti TaxID=509963 RepID=UPI002905D869|nr:MORN repeat-containing protein 4-like [Ylistrum balloti]
MKTAYKYPDGSEYNGEWSEDGQRQGYGHMKFPDGAQYYGMFVNGLCEGLGVMVFSDNSRYEGEFQQGKFSGMGAFLRCDGMKFEGEFQEGKIRGQGIVTFPDGTHGLPRNEGYFDGNKMLRREKCMAAIQKAKQIADSAKSQRS